MEKSILTPLEINRQKDYYVYCCFLTGLTAKWSFLLKKYLFFGLQRTCQTREYPHYRAKAVRLWRIILVRSARAEQAQEVLRLLA